jgi:CRISPR/Cas system-associated exonuclease Cas4 (RecB family)
MAKKQYDIKKERNTNWLQLASYAKILNKPKISLVFISKDDLCIVEYVEFTKNWIENLEAEYKTLNDFWNSKILPPAKPRAYNGKECQYCNYKDLCLKTDGKKGEK